MMAEERFIQFIWKYRLYQRKSLYTSCGKKLEILYPGERNYHGGPDFFNARIRIGSLFWAGNVEIHRQASDWYRHRHHLDPAYNNVILHVVEDFDTDVTNSLGRRIQAMVPLYPEYLIRRFEILQRSESWLACREYMDMISVRLFKQWLPGLLKDRLGQKAGRMERILQESKKDPDLALYSALVPGYGIPLNTLPFEMLGKKLPIPAMLDHRDNLNDLEAILFGLSGLLSPARRRGSYPSSLWTRYRELISTFTDNPLPLHLWKFLRSRPPSFPTIRLSQLASLFHTRYPLAETILGCSSMGELEQVFRVCASEYWTNHFLFGKSSPPIPKYPGQQFTSTLIINIIVPFLTALQKLSLKTSSGMESDEILQNLKAESNRILKNWSIFGIRADDAGESQALLHLYQNYCKQKRCLECHIGIEIIQDAIHKSK